MTPYQTTMRLLETTQQVLTVGAAVAGSMSLGTALYLRNNCYKFIEIINASNRILTSHTKLNAQKSYDQLNCAEKNNLGLTCLNIGIFGFACMVTIFLIGRRMRSSRIREAGEEINDLRSRLETDRERILNAGENIGNNAAEELERINADLGRLNALQAELARPA